MNKYKVEYKGSGIPKEDEINYGNYYANSSIEAIEQIVELDPTRSIYDLKTELDIRHWGMIATLISSEPDVLTKLEQMKEDTATMKEQFNQLEKLYHDTLEELIKYKESALYGAIFKYYEREDQFIPIFGEIKNLHFGLEKPHSFKINFDQELLAHWLTECHLALEKDEEEE